MKRKPVWTFAVCTAAAAAWLVPQAGDWLVLDRQAVLHGQIWRLVTGHLVHFSWSHLLLNMAALAATAGLLESLTPIRRAVLFLAVPVAISLALLVFAPTMASYGGLSGLATAALVWLTLHAARFNGPVPRWLALPVLGVALVKMTREWFQPMPLFASFAGDSIATAPISHVAGGLLALACFAANCVNSKQPTSPSADTPRGGGWSRCRW